MPFAIFSTGSSSERGTRREGHLLSALLFAAGPLTLVLLLAAAPCARAAEPPRIAVFPPVDLTGRAAPVDLAQEALEASLSDRGFAILPRADLEAFFTKHRVRYTGGLSEETARAIAAEAGVGTVLLASVDDFETVDPPRFAITVRRVAVPAATIGWMRTSAQHGQERPGAFGLGIVTNVDELIERAADDIAASLADPRPPKIARAPKRWRPGSFAIDPHWASAAASPPRPLRVAILPFVVDAARREAGEMLASQLAKWLLTTGRLEILEPGVVRDALLEARVIQEDGPSLPQVDALRALLDVDLIVSGRLTDYEAMGSAPGSPYLGFSISGIDARTRQAVWSSFSFGRGDDREGLFGTARVRSSITLASELVHGAVETLDEEIRR